MGKISITCGFCDGKGMDPFDLLSELSVCQVCNGKGTVSIVEPTIRCPFCSGSGVYPNSRLTCTVCGGKGQCEIAEGMMVRCSFCQGSGRTSDSGLPCVKCKGIGVVSYSV